MGGRNGLGILAAASMALLASASPIHTERRAAAGPPLEPSRSNRRRQSSGSLGKILATARNTGRR